jgi:hypothetical protein
LPVARAPSMTTAPEIVNARWSGPSMTRGRYPCPTTSSVSTQPGYFSAERCNRCRPISEDNPTRLLQRFHAEMCSYVPPF